MYKNIEVITLEEQKNSGVANIESFTFAKDIRTAPITVNEYYEACKTYPILFTKTAENEWFSLALLGLDDRNQFVDKDGVWRKHCYVPAHIKRYPFLFVENNKRLLLAFDSECKVSKDTAGDRYFFEESGEHSNFLKQVITAMNQAQAFSKTTKEFIKMIDELGLLEESGIKGQNSEGKEISMGGFWVIKEDKFNELNPKEKAKLCKKGYMQPLTAHLISISNIQKLLD